MAGTFEDQAALAGLTAFKDKCKVQLVKKSLAALAAGGFSADQDVDIRTYKAILVDPDDYAARAAALLAFHPTVTTSQFAPAVPTDEVMEYCIDQILPRLIR